MEREYPVYAIAAVGCVVVRNDEILLVKRGYPPSKGYWSVPGGVVEADESLFDAAIRELEEETGLKGRPLGVVAVTDVSTRENGRVKYRYVIVDICFDPDSLEGELKPGGDAVDVKWFPLKEVVGRGDVTRSTKKLVEIMINKGINYIDVITPCK